MSVADTMRTEVIGSPELRFPYFSFQKQGGHFGGLYNYYSHPNKSVKPYRLNRSQSPNKNRPMHLSLSYLTS
jgi:hypothetical protein